MDSFAVALREFGSKCGFTGAEYSHRIVDQFILGLRDRSTQSKLLQEPPENIDAALLIARRFEAANATMMKLNAESFEAKQQPAVRSVGSTRPAKVCFSCSGYGHVARECPTIRKNVAAPRERSNRYRVVCFKCNKQGHLARDCFQLNTSFSPNRQVNNQNFGRRSVSCFNCGQEGHISRFCNFPEAQNQNMRQSEQGESLQYDRQKPSEQTRPDSKVRLSSISATNKRKTLMIEASVNGNSCLCVVDTGASISLIGKSQWDILNKDSSCEMLPSDIVAEAANNSLIGIVGKTVLSVCVNGRQLSDQTFYVANDMKEIILGLDWMMSRHCVIDVPKLLISFPDGSAAPLLIHDSSIVDPMSVVPCEIPGNHEVIKRGKVKTPFINDSILEPNLPVDVRGEGDEEERKPVGGPAQYLKELKERHKHLKSFVQNRVQREQEKQKKNYDSRHRAEKYTDFVVGELVLLKNHRARGLDSKYVGPYRVVRVLEEDCEIECPRTHKRRVVHVNNLRPFSVDRVEPENNNELLAESDGSDDDEFMYIVTKPAVGNENVLQEPVRYNLRRNRRQPDRYGVPIYDY